MRLVFGNVKPRDLAARIGADFTDDELRILEDAWTPVGSNIGTGEWHAFDDPALQVHVGPSSEAVLSIFMAANERKPFTCPLPFYPAGGQA